MPTIGFAPAGDVYYDYTVAPVANITTDFIGTADGDLDGDGNDGQFTMDDARAFTDVNPGQW